MGFLSNFFAGRTDNRKGGNRRKATRRQSPALLKPARLALEPLERRELLAVTWDGGGANGNWSDPLNWESDTLPTAGADLIFAGSQNISTNSNLGLSFKSITFADSGFSIAGSLTVTDGITVQSTATSATIAAGVALGGTINVNVATSLTVSGAISGTGYGVTKIGDGTLTLSGNNTYTGGTTVSAGVLMVSNLGDYLSLDGNSSTTEGAQYSLLLQSRDPASITIDRWEINWGDNTGVQTVTGNPSSVTHAYADGTHTYTVSATAIDDHGPQGSVTKSVSVQNVAPKVTLTNSNPVGYWKLDGTLADSSGNNNTGTFVGTGQQWVAGRYGNGVQFDATNQVRATNVPVNTTAGAKNTVAFWMKWDGTAGQTVVDFGATYCLYLSGSNISFNTGVGDHLYTSFPASQWANQWVQITAVFYNGVLSADTVALYINGQRVQSFQQSGTPQPRSASSTFYMSGCANTSNPTYRFSGVLDDVRVYNRELTAEEALALARDNPNIAGEGETRHYTIRTSDPGTADTFSTVNVSGGTSGTVSNLTFNSATGTGSFDVTFGNGPGNSTVSVQVQDSDGYVSNVASLDVAIENVAPTVAISGPGTVKEGETKHCTFTASDPRASDVLSLLSVAGDSLGTVSNWQFDSVTRTGGFDVTFGDLSLANSPAFSTVTVQVQDSEGGVSNTGLLSIRIEDAVASLTLTGDNTVAVGNTYTLNLGPVSALAADTITGCTINWDDGAATALSSQELAQLLTIGSCSVAHVYTNNPGTYITVDLADEDGVHYAVAKKAITVTGVSPMASLVKDINTTSQAGSSPHDFLVIGSIAYFVAATPTGNAELWRTDGTEANTYRVKSVNCGYRSPGDSYYSPYLTSVNGTLYFVGDDGDGNTTLWKSNGTEAGTVKVANVSSPSYLVSVNGVLFFRATDAAGGSELWKSDGTEAGTVRVKDIYPGTTGSSPYNLTNVGGTLFFTAADATGGNELWKSDGTEAGTVRVKDIYSGTSSSGPSYLTNVGGTLFFTATDSATGVELWKSDGTDIGTVRVKDIYSGSSGSSPYYLTNVNGTLFFRAADSSGGYELWKSDGTGAGTLRVKDIYSGTGSSSPSYLTNVGGTLFFTATDSTGGSELWKSDGTDLGTVRVKDIYSGTSGSSPSYLTNVGGTLFFTATDSTGGSELWKSDGTDLGTVRVKDIYPGTTGSGPYSLIDFNGTLLFRATDANGDIELWKSDGTEAGTVRVKDIYANGGGSSPANITVATDVFYFTATDGATGTELWVSNGAQGGTSRVKDIYVGANSSSPSSLTILNGIVYFAANDGTTGSELWRSDGTKSGTYLVKDIYSGASGSSPFNLTVMNGKIYFAASDSAGGNELWVTDGTTNGTTRVKDIYSGTSGSYPLYLTVMNDWLYFQATDSAGGYELWKTDGTDANTTRVMDIYSGTWSSSPVYLKVVGDWLYFRATTSAEGTELWKSDGTAANTSLVKDIYAGTGSSSPSNLTVMNGQLYFTAGDSTGGTELWTTDGTAANTARVMDINAGAGSSSPSSFAVVGNTLYFTANDGSHGTEVWKTDGTAANTSMVKDIMAGKGSPWLYTSPTFVNVNDTVFFMADNGSGGTELWKTDGTTAGTARVMDIRSGVGSSNPGSLKNVDGTLYFAASNGEGGTELWAVRPPGGGGRILHRRRRRCRDSFGGVQHGRRPAHLRLGPRRRRHLRRDGHGRQPRRRGGRLADLPQPGPRQRAPERAQHLHRQSARDRWHRQRLYRHRIDCNYAHLDLGPGRTEQRRVRRDRRLDANEHPLGRYDDQSAVQLDKRLQQRQGHLHGRHGDHPRHSERDGCGLEHYVQHGRLFHFGRWNNHPYRPRRADHRRNRNQHDRLRHRRLGRPHQARRRDACSLRRQHLYRRYDRPERPPAGRQPWLLFVDEWQQFGQ